MLKIKNLTKSIKDKSILNDLTFEVSFGQLAIFLGGSGVGKSTLLRVLNHLEAFEKGILELDGEPLKKEDVGMVFQHFNLFENLNVEENIIYTLVHAKNYTLQDAKKCADELLELYELSSYSQAKVSTLSGGQKQRLAIARTVSTNPRIICMDEPTSALDPKLTGQIADCIKKLTKQGKIILLTTHDIGLIEQLEGTYFLMEKGCIVEEVKQQKYISNKEAYPKLYNFLQGQ